MQSQMDGFRQLQSYLDVAPAATIGIIKPTSLWEYGGMIVRLIVFVVKVILRFPSTRPEAWRKAGSRGKAAHT
jgi:hypothetical protein